MVKQNKFHINYVPLWIDYMKSGMIDGRVFSQSTLDNYILTDRLGEKMNRRGLYKRLKRIGRKAGVKVNPHACRRGFVTTGVKRGIPLSYLQIACGHSSITTTESYCMTTELDVINSMKEWE